jgi:anti-sigma-K factor RskA
MSAPLSHDDAFAMLPELALGMLSADDAARVMEVVASSPEHAAELASLRAAASTLASATEAAPLAPSRKASMRDRLVTRAAASVGADATGTVDTETPTSSVIIPSTPAPSLKIERSAQVDPAAVRRPTVTVAPPAPSPLRFLPWLAMAASVAFAVVQVTRSGAIESERNAAQSALKSATVANSRLTSELLSRDSLVAALTGAKVRVVDLASTSNLEPGARMFWDQLTNRWTLITHDLKPVPAGRTYQLWLVTAKSEKISAGTFNTDARGRAVVQATYALAEADLAAIAITEEPEGGSPQPTGTILVAGAGTK